MGFSFIFFSITEILAAYGYYGLFLGTFLSSMFLPMGSDLLFIGMLAAGMDPWICLLVATSGNWLGGFVIYGISYSGNKEKIGRWFRIKEKTLEKQKIKIDKYGSWLALTVWIPIIGDAANIALGFYRTKPRLTLTIMFLSRMFRFLVWVLLYLVYANHLVKFIDSL